VTALLEAERLTCGYGDTAVVRDLDFHVDRGEILAVLGPNGAGKTTVLLTLAGLLRSMSGTIRLDGELLEPGRGPRTVRRGVIAVPDDRSLFTQLTVAENLKLADRKGAMTIDHVLDLFPPLRPRLGAKAGLLSGGEQQMLALGRAIVQSPKVLLIDEMSMGLAPLVVESILPVLRTVCADTGAAVILVEQHLQVAMKVAARFFVLVHGEVTYAGTTTDFLAHRDNIEAAYLGITPQSSR
jgi:branched-chain amino acid transport system ATP-binding protein